MKHAADGPEEGPASRVRVVSYPCRRSHAHLDSAAARKAEHPSRLAIRYAGAPSSRCAGSHRHRGVSRVRSRVRQPRRRAPQAGIESPGTASSIRAPWRACDRAPRRVTHARRVRPGVSRDGQGDLVRDCAPDDVAPRDRRPRGPGIRRLPVSRGASCASSATPSPGPASARVSGQILSGY